MRGLFASLFLTMCLAGAPAQAAPFRQAPGAGPHAEAFVPAGWDIELSTEGDLDADGAADRVLVLLERVGKPEGERERALLVLFKREQGYTLGASNSGLVSCYECLGVKGGDARPNVEIRRGVLVVSQLGGSRDWYAVVHRFRFRAANGKLELIGVDSSYGDGLTGESSETSLNLITGRTLTVSQPAQVDDEGRELTPRRPTRKQGRQKIAPLQPLEALDTAFP